MVDDGFWKQQGWMFSKDIWWPLTGSHSIQVNRDSSWTFYGSHRKPHNPDWLYQISLKIVPQYPMEPLILQTSSLHPGLVCNLLIIIIIMVIIIITVIIIINLSSLGEFLFTCFAPALAYAYHSLIKPLQKICEKLLAKTQKLYRFLRLASIFN